MLHSYNPTPVCIFNTGIVCYLCRFDATKFAAFYHNDNLEGLRKGGRALGACICVLGGVLIIVHKYTYLPGFRWVVYISASQFNVLFTL